MTDPSPADRRRRQYPRKLVDLPSNVVEFQRDAGPCIRCGDDYSDKQPVAHDDGRSTQLVECIDAETCARRISQLRRMGL